MTTGVNREDQEAALHNSIQVARQRWLTTIRAERDRQISKGYTAEHDAEHGIEHLLNWAIEYARKGEAVKSSALILAALDLLDRAQILSESEGKK